MFKKATKQAQGGGGGVETVSPILTPGSYPARVVQIVDLGMQPGSTMYPEPKLKMEMRFELLDEFLQDKEGNELESKPRWFSYELTYNADGYMGERSNIYKVFDALNGFDKDIEDLLGTPCMVAIAKGLKQDGKTEKNKVTGVAAMRSKDAEKAEPLKNDPLYFSLMNPDMEVWKKLSSKGQYSQQTKIKNSLELHLTPLAALLGEAQEGSSEENETTQEEESGSESDSNSNSNEQTNSEPEPQGGKADEAEDIFD